uniref:Nuclear receptor domain-containing protein n=1 Tax=Heterorhabditis bacteriophora TaxID=37862 RepID=A0A1I7X6Y9_HETBA
MAHDIVQDRQAATRIKSISALCGLSLKISLSSDRIFDTSMIDGPPSSMLPSSVLRQFGGIHCHEFMSFLDRMIPMNSIKLANTSPSLEDVNQTCHICYDSSDGLHFAVYTCRACAAFFRRTVSLKLQYNCRAEGKCAIEKSVQKARDGIGKRKEYGQKSLVVKRPSAIDPIQPSSSEGTPYYPKSELLNGQFAFTSMMTTKSEKVILKFATGYLHFLTIRKATHSLVDNENLTQRFQKNDGLRWPLELRPSNFDSSKKVCQLEAHLVTDIVNTYFYPFNELQFTEKVTLFKNFFCYLSHTDWAYQSYKLFGQDESETKRKWEMDICIIFRPAMDFILNVIIAHMRRINLTELEYIAILGFFCGTKRSVVMLRENSELAELFNIFEADVCCKSFKGET